MRRKSKTDSDFLAFPSVKFRKIWQTGSKYVILVGDHFFFAKVKDINLHSRLKPKILTKTIVKPYFIIAYYN